MDEEIIKIKSLLDSEKFEEANMALEEALNKQSFSGELLTLKWQCKIKIGEFQEANKILSFMENTLDKEVYQGIICQSLNTINIRKQLAYEYLVGRGIEFGALHNPLPIHRKKASVVYADRLTKLQALQRFPELKEVISPDLIIDFDKDDISFLVNYDFDFFIANHFIEHVANPIRFLRDLSSVMKSGSILFLTVPNKEYTFDKKRGLTENEHLWQDYINNETNISDEHIEDFVLNTGDKIGLPATPSERKKIFNMHRGRSIHVHVWNRFSFDNFLNWINYKLDLRFEVMNTHDPNTVLDEMIYLLRKQ